MSRITNWPRESHTPTLAYRNSEFGERSLLHQAPDSYGSSGAGRSSSILVDNYPTCDEVVCPQ
ncbi:hypothetical protein DU484_07775 [Haloplanus rubicundus]|uniref:Uncharacterized protein n=1 Tax=Haloplanus rubicundus TaxID=1547898 RepID=A0A345EC39_9EURY|nr:hypothetical protein DU484_07775 [Haloplanus rubicundus]